LELAQLSPLPPQDSVSTNFTTTASTRRPHAKRILRIGQPTSLHCKYVGLGRSFMWCCLSKPLLCG
ncbi:MAG: hypothetical protein EBQ69_01405, partial [Betaproteobacteria bacterium]|nr:hypothetical protein [Betaproteobacteria bacterium]